MSEVNYTFPISKYVSSYGSCPYYLKDIVELCTHYLVDDKSHGQKESLEIQGGSEDSDDSDKSENTVDNSW